MRFSFVHFAAGAALLAVTPSMAFADDWVATRVLGGVVQWTDGAWVQIQRGDVVPDDRKIRTIEGRIAFERGNEVIELGRQTEIRIVDKPGKSYTIVKQQFGEVTIEADIRQVEHFSVETPLIAAVVKGTKFTVVSGEHSARVSVQRGKVSVEDADTEQTTVIEAGQSVETGDAGVPLLFDGHGKSPVVFDADGKPVSVPGRGHGSENGNGPEKSGDNPGRGVHSGAGDSGNDGGNGNGNGNGNGGSDSGGGSNGNGGGSSGKKD